MTSIGTKTTKMTTMASDITLISIITSEDFITKTARSMLYSLEQMNFARAIIICPQQISPINKIEFKYVPITGDYSQWLLSDLVKHVDTKFCLVHQWDSAVIDSSKWTDEFLEYDYIGAPWPSGQYRVGNGGFSLRSHKFLTEVSRASSLLKTGADIIGNEDLFCCAIARPYLESVGIKFAPLQLARQFSVERPIPEAPHNYNDLSTYNSFGFHGEFNTAGMRLINDNTNI